MKRLPGRWTTPWSDTPPLKLDWFEIAGHDAAALLARIDIATAQSPLGPFSLRHVIENIRAAELPFYPGHLLIDIQADTPEEFLNPSAIASFVYGPTGVTALDGQALPIHHLNSSVLKLDGNDMTIDYLRFFCTFVRGEDGPFLFVEREEDISFKPRTTKKKKAEVTSMLFAPRPATHKDTPAGTLCIEASLHYGAALFASTFAVFPSGMVEMLDDNPLFQDARLLSRGYNDIYRIPPH